MVTLNWHYCGIIRRRFHSLSAVGLTRALINYNASCPWVVVQLYFLALDSRHLPGASLHQKCSARTASDHRRTFDRRRWWSMTLRCVLWRCGAPRQRLLRAWFRIVNTFPVLNKTDFNNWLQITRNMITSLVIIKDGGARDIDAGVWYFSYFVHLKLLYECFEIWDNTNMSQCSSDTPIAAVKVAVRCC